MPPLGAPEIPDEGEDEGSTEAMVPMSMAIIFLIIGLVVGFILGRIEKIIGFIVRMLKKMSKKEESDAKEDNEGINDEEDLDQDEARELISKFLDSNMHPGIDDNPEVEFNPVWDFRIRKQKEKEKLLLRQKQAEEMGINLDEEDEHPQDMGGGRQNPLSLLISVGARVVGVHSVDNAAALAAKEARRKMKNIESYLTKQMDIDTALVKKDANKKLDAKKKISVYEMAMKTKNDHGPKDALSALAITNAKSSRDQLRELLRTKPELQKFGAKPKRKTMKRRQAARHAGDDEEGGGEGGGGGLGDLAKLHAAGGDLADLLEGEDDEGEEGEEGSYEDDDGSYEDEDDDGEEDTKKLEA